MASEGNTFLRINFPLLNTSKFVAALYDMWYNPTTPIPYKYELDKITHDPKTSIITFNFVATLGNYPFVLKMIDTRIHEWFSFIEEKLGLGYNNLIEMIKKELSADKLNWEISFMYNLPKDKLDRIEILLRMEGYYKENDSNMAYMFKNCTNLKEVNFSSLMNISIEHK